MIALADIQRAAIQGRHELGLAVDALRAVQPARAARSSEERWEESVALRVDFARRHHRTHKGEALNLTPLWLREIYNFDGKRVVIKKSVQCGISEWVLCLEIADAAAGLNVFHVLPTFAIRNRFVQERVNLSILNTDRYQELQMESLGDVDNLSLKHLGPGSIYWVSADTRKSFIEVAADVAIVDEVDRCDQQNLAMLHDRLSGEHSARSTVMIGNPSHADYGISREYDESDACEWQIKCRECGEWQPLDFFVNVIKVHRDSEGNEQDYELLDREWSVDSGRDVHMCCRKCGKPIDRHENQRSHCRWKPQHSGSDVRGYQVSKLFTRQTTVAELWRRWCESASDQWQRQIFMNSDLGLEYSPPGSALTDEILRACCRDYVMPGSVGDHPCSMGVDVGSMLDVRISDHPEPGVRRAVFIGRVRSFDDLSQLMKRYHVRACVIDAEPEVRKAIEWADSFGTGRKRRVWRADLLDTSVPRALPHAALDTKAEADDGLLRLDRTQLLDLATGQFADRTNWLPLNGMSLLRGKYVEQMKVNKRVLETRSDGSQHWRWTKGVDHQRFADAFDAYATVGLGVRFGALSQAGACGIETVRVDCAYGNY